MFICLSHHSKCICFKIEFPIRIIIYNWPSKLLSNQVVSKFFSGNRIAFIHIIGRI